MTIEICHLPSHSTDGSLGLPQNAFEDAPSTNKSIDLVQSQDKAWSQKFMYSWTKVLSQNQRLPLCLDAKSALCRWHPCVPYSRCSMETHEARVIVVSTLRECLCHIQGFRANLSGSTF